LPRPALHAHADERDLVLQRGVEVEEEFVKLEDAGRLDAARQNVAHAVPLGEALQFIQPRVNGFAQIRLETKAGVEALGPRRNSRRDRYFLCAEGDGRRQLNEGSSFVLLFTL